VDRVGAVYVGIEMECCRPRGRRRKVLGERGRHRLAALLQTRVALALIGHHLLYRLHLQINQHTLKSAYNKSVYLFMVCIVSVN
jgi:hypothetical protein